MTFEVLLKQVCNGALFTPKRCIIHYSHNVFEDASESFSAVRIQSLHTPHLQRSAVYLSRVKTIVWALPHIDFDYLLVVVTCITAGSLGKSRFPLPAKRACSSKRSSGGVCLESTWLRFPSILPTGIGTLKKFLNADSMTSYGIRSFGCPFEVFIQVSFCQFASQYDRISQCVSQCDVKCIFSSYTKTQIKC